MRRRESVCPLRRVSSSTRSPRPLARRTLYLSCRSWPRSNDYDRPGGWSSLAYPKWNTRHRRRHSTLHREKRDPQSTVLAVTVAATTVVAAAPVAAAKSAAVEETP